MIISNPIATAGRTVLPVLASPLIAVVTAAASNSFGHLKNFLTSLEIQEYQGHEVFVVDFGLSQSEKRYIGDRRVELINPKRLACNDIAAAQSTWRICPSLNNLFSDTDIIIWLEAGVWLQSSRYLGDLVRFLQQYEVLLAPALHAAYGSANFDAHFTPWIGRYGHLSGRDFDRISRDYGHSIACKLARRSMFDGGVLGGWTHSSFWDQWKAVHQRIRRNSETCGSERISLNVTASVFDGPVGMLPATYDWLCHNSPPAYDPVTAQLASPVLGHEPLHAINIAQWPREKAMRLPVLDGRTLEACLCDTATVRSILKKESLLDRCC